MMPDTRRVAIALAGAAAMLNLYAPQAVLPLLADEFGRSPAEISLIMTASAFAIALTAPFTGVIADVLGRKRVIAAALVALVVPDVMIALSPDLQWLIFWRFLQGFFLPPIFAVCMAYIGGEWSPAEATGVAGLFTAMTAVGGFLGRFLTGVLAEPIGWRGAFLADAALTAFCAFAVILLLPREKKFVRAESLSASLTQMLRHLRNPKLIGTYAVGFGVLFNFMAAYTFVSFLLAAPPYNLSPAALGSLFFVYLIGSVTTPSTGRLVARFGRKRFVTGIIGLWICGIALTLVPSLPVIVLGLAIAAACGFFCQATSQSFIAVTTKKGTSAAIGLYVTAFYVGGAVGGSLPGLTWAQGGWPATIAMVIAMLVIMVMTVQLTWEGKHA